MVCASASVIAVCACAAGERGGDIEGAWTALIFFVVVDA
jgi:hypothetical protein